MNDTRIATTSFVRNRITFGSVCSGIEAASVAWDRLGWRCAWVAEIEAFPSSVLAQRFPHVPNLGDMTTIAARILAGEVEAPDVLVGGTPCQAFSVAGLRAGLSDSRGQLTLAFVILANAIDAARAIRGKPPCVVLWENVPGVLTDKTNAFGHLLGGLAGEDDALVPAGKKWANAGAVFGPERSAAWRLLDAQYFRVAQRRRRCFVIASARDGFDPTAVLFDWQGVRRDSAPSRGAWAGAAAGALRSTDGGSDVDHALAGHLQPVVAAPVTRSVERPRGDGLDPLVVCMAHGQGGAEIAEDRAPTLTCNHEAPIACYPVVGAVPCESFAFKASHFTRGKDGAPSAIAPPLSADADKGDQDTLVCAPRFAVAFSCKDHGADATVECAPTMRAMGFAGSHANGGGQLAVAIGFDSRQDPVSSEHVAGALGSGRSQAQAVCVAIPLQEVGKRTGVSTSDIRAGLGIGDDGDPMFTLQATAQHGVAMCVFDPNQITNPNNRSNPTPGLCHTLPAVVTPPVLYGTRMAVRRLTPVECERLQGFPDGWTAVVYRGKQAADGPRYKALGNSMAVPCMAFLGRRIAAYFNGELIRGLC